MMDSRSVIPTRIALSSFAPDPRALQNLWVLLHGRERVKGLVLAAEFKGLVLAAEFIN